MLEHYLTKEQIEQYREQLKSKLIDNKLSLEQKKKDTQFNVAADADILDIAANVEIRNRTISEIDRHAKIIKNIESALKVPLDEFGYCEECGIEIGEDRLNFDASYKRCIDCQQLHENNTRLFPSLAD